jgi:hypothetical protein
VLSDFGLHPFDEIRNPCIWAGRRFGPSEAVQFLATLSIRRTEPTAIELADGSDEAERTYPNVTHVVVLPSVGSCAAKSAV